jgi:hypothetical protein
VKPLIAHEVFTDIAQQFPEWTSRPATPGIPYSVQLAFSEVPQPGIEAFSEQLKRAGYQLLKIDGEKVWRKQLSSGLIVEVGDIEPIVNGAQVYSVIFRLIAPTDYSGIKIFVSTSGDIKRDLADEVDQEVKIVNSVPTFVGDVTRYLQKQAPPAAAVDSLVNFVAKIDRVLEAATLPSNIVIPEMFDIYRAN